MAFSGDEFIVMKNRSEVARGYGWREGCDLERVVGGRFCFVCIMEEFCILIMVVVINALIYTCGKFHRSTHTKSACKNW